MLDFYGFVVVGLDFVGLPKTIKNLHGVQGVASSNPATPTIKIKDLASKGAKSFFFFPSLRIAGAYSVPTRCLHGFDLIKNSPNPTRPPL